MNARPAGQPENRIGAAQSTRGDVAAMRDKVRGARDQAAPWRHLALSELFIAGTAEDWC